MRHNSNIGRAFVPTRLALALAGAVATRLNAWLKGAIAAGAAVAILGAGGNGPAAAEETASREYLIKAAILYNFARFTEWPEQAFAGVSQFRLCVLGTDPFGAALESIESKPVQGRPVAILRLSNPAEAAACHLLYLGDAADGVAAGAVAALGAAPVLTVGEIPLFSRSGGHIEMLTVDDRVRFGINQAGAERAGLKFSAKLLNLADPALDATEKTRYATPR